MTFDLAAWQERLDEMCATYHIPGASLAVLTDGTIHELASGVLNSATGVAVTTDSVFLSGSTAKVYTATLIMQLADAGKLDLDAPVVQILPEFATPDADATQRITIRQLLSHTGGVTNDFNYDSGRGDDCLAKYVAAARTVPLDLPPGTAYSYGSLGYVVLGRIIEVVTGSTWDRALADMIFTPLGLQRSMTLPEQALRFRVAMGHTTGPNPEPASAWDVMPRSAGPYGRVIVSAADMVRLARMHIDGGIASDGTRLLSAEAVTAMQRRQIDTPDKWTMSADGWGLGWALYDWDGITGYGHDGSAVTQHSYLRVVPSAGVAVALLINGGEFTRLYSTLVGRLLTELAGVRMPAPFAPPANPPAVDMQALVGVYQREGVRITVDDSDGPARIRYEFIDGMKGLAPAFETTLTPVSDTVFAATGGPDGEDYTPVVFAITADGTPCVYVSMRATPKIA
ncbi:beta-lactamase family protein [Nocardia sp. NEAU-G5]|uniref:Beta-lactamase family protein n=1 Tax=Nocardia albiluteola TaxID=2842303 RepID=A0ABS6BF37_9NOCA|nr:serine hydrolase domain-containing protein [Nocardia albiluteola]MBU3068126.1 beta-lactamase family protein [Nocardia albiluteola]